MKISPATLAPVLEPRPDPSQPSHTGTEPHSVTSGCLNRGRVALRQRRPPQRPRYSPPLELLNPGNRARRRDQGEGSPFYPPPGPSVLSGGERRPGPWIRGTPTLSRVLTLW